MKIADGIEMLNISANVMGTLSFIHPTLLWDNGSVVLVDAGYPGQLPYIREAIEKAGIPLWKLNKVIITHHDIDHMGSLLSIADEVGKIEVIAHEEEKPYIQGDKRPLKVAELEAKLNSLTEERKEIYEKMNAFYRTGMVKVGKTVADGEELPYCGGITVIHTPGHTLGHICLYIRQNKTLIAGDALWVKDGLLVIPPRSTFFNMGMHMQSLKKLTEYNIEKVICYHGGLFDRHVNQCIAKLAAV